MINRDIISAFSEIARDKNVDRSELSDIIETVFRKIIVKKFGSDENFDVIVNMDKGEIEIYQQKVIVENVEDPVQEISLEDALEVEPDLEVGDSFQIDAKNKDTAAKMAQKAQKKYGKTFRAREMPDGTFRVWRVT